MRSFIALFLVLVASAALGTTPKHQTAGLNLFTADNKNIQYTGRIDFTNPARPRIWAPGVYIEARFKGAHCQLLINDEVPGGKNHNYLEIIIDGKNPYRVKLADKTNVITLPDGLSPGAHTVMICKNTESNIGYIDFVGLRCQGLLPLPPKPKRKIEYFGDSITSGAGMDQSAVPCDKGQWFDQHNAYLSYGPTTSRNLHAQWHLTSLAGLGLVHSCCNMKVLLPQIYDKVFLINDSLSWNFNAYQPDVVTICIGQNDGPQDSVFFCSTYIKFIASVRSHYPRADIVCLTSPMAEPKFTLLLKTYLTAITAYMNLSGDSKVHKFFFSRRYHNGCGDHPDVAEHKLIADELTAYIKELKGWN